MRAFLLVIGLLIALALPAVARERIDSFTSDITINADGSIDVSEIITVTVEGDQIRRGIYRDFPTRYYDRRGLRVTAGFDVLSVERDGAAEPYTLEGIPNGTRIRIGDADRLLSFGYHTYEIKYRTTRQIGFFQDYDELYWNVTGNDWAFPINKARVIIRLPPHAEIRQSAAYTGPQGAKGTDYEIVTGSGDVFRAETTRPLAPREGFTVAVAWQKGILTPPSETQRWGWWFSDNMGLIALVLGALATAGYYFYAWDRVGRDPPAGTIVPLFAPPKGMSPAGARYIREKSFDDRGFAAALVGLAVKGRLKISDYAGTFSIDRSPQPWSNAPGLEPAEKSLLEALPYNALSLKQSNHTQVRAAKNTLEKALQAEYEGKAFIRNLSWFWKGALLSIAVLILSAVLMPRQDAATGLFTILWSAIWWGVIIAILWSAVNGFKSSQGFFRKIGSLLPMAFVIPFFIGGLAGPLLMLMESSSTAHYALIGAAALLGVMNLVFFYLLRAPTIPGRKLLDELEGFRMYMTTAEEERLKILHPPEKTPELFERYLPYALALDCENEWNSKFTAVLAAAAAAGAAAAPSWYTGSNWSSGSFTSSLGSSLASSVASASTAPGSSSGSGGGGFSGGGGGGGGGGGW